MSQHLAKVLINDGRYHASDGHGHGHDYGHGHVSDRDDSDRDVRSQQLCALGTGTDIAQSSRVDRVSSLHLFACTVNVAIDGS